MNVNRDFIKILQILIIPNAYLVLVNVEPVTIKRENVYRVRVVTEMLIITANVILDFLKIVSNNVLLVHTNVEHVMVMLTHV